MRPNNAITCYGSYSSGQSQAPLDTFKAVAPGGTRLRDTDERHFGLLGIPDVARRGQLDGHRG